MFWLLPLTITGNGEYISRKELTHLGFTDLRFTHISLLSSTAICRQRLPCFLWSVRSFSQSISKRLVSVALMSGCVPLSKRKLSSAISFSISNSHGLQNASVTFSCSSLCICISRRSVLSLKACFSLRARSIGSGSSGFVISRSAWDLLVTLILLDIVDVRRFDDLGWLCAVFERFAGVCLATYVETHPAPPFRAHGEACLRGRCLHLHRGCRFRLHSPPLHPWVRFHRLPCCTRGRGLPLEKQRKFAECLLSLNRPHGLLRAFQLSMR